ncbi:hypothetical protein HN51_001875, partial [Arachis hypogaea]
KVKNPDFLNEVSSVCNKEEYLIVDCQSYNNVKDMGWGLYGVGQKQVSSEIIIRERGSLKCS